jgi:hypothetical protein
MPDLWLITCTVLLTYFLEFTPDEAGFYSVYVCLNNKLQSCFLNIKEENYSQIGELHHFFKENKQIFYCRVVTVGFF